MIERNATVRVKKLITIDDPNLPEVFVGNRKRNKVGTVDSPVYMTLSRLWLVKHDTSGVFNGISVGRYGIYHEDELETIEAPPIKVIELPRKSTNDFIMFNDEDFTYSDWDDVPD